MRKFWLHLGFIVPIFIVCASFMLLFIAQNAITSYEKILGRDYAVILVAKKPLALPAIKHAKELKKIEPDEVLKRLSKQLSANNLAALQKTLPHFYSLQFDQFMSAKAVETARKKLLKNPDISRVEAFSKTHSKVYHLLILLKVICAIFAALISALCLALFSKQVHIWHYEHSERIYILELFGASFLGRSGFLLKMIVLDLLIVYLLLLGIFSHFAEFSFVAEFFAKLDIPLEKFPAELYLAGVCAVVAVVSFIAAAMVLKRQTK